MPFKFFKYAEYIIFQQDGPYLHCAVLVRQYCDRILIKRLMKRFGATSRPSCSPYLMPCDFFHETTEIYCIPLTSGHDPEEEDQNYEPCLQKLTKIV